MTIILALLVGVLFTAGIYLLLRRSLVKVIFGLAILSHASHLLIFTAGGLVRARPAIVPAGETTLPPGTADPLPQALILTAIVISFGVLAYVIVLARRATDAARSDDTSDLRAAEGPGPIPDDPSSEPRGSA